MKNVLLDIGLTEKEAELYLLAIKHKEVTASQIARISSESRTHTYDTINTLIKKGLLTYVIKNNIKYFKAVNPERLLNYLKEKSAKIEEEEKSVRKIIPQLKDIQQKSGEEEPKIEIYEGKEGLKSLLNDIISEGKDFVTWGATTKVKEHLPDFVIQKYLNERKKRNIRARQLFTDSYGVLKSPLSKNKKLPKEFANPTTTLIYGNKVAIFLWTEMPKIILVESKELAGSYKTYFELLWEFGENID